MPSRRLRLPPRPPAASARRLHLPPRPPAASAPILLPHPPQNSWSPRTSTTGSSTRATRPPPMPPRSPQLAHAFFVSRFELGDTAAVEDGDAAEAKEDLLDNAGRGAGAWAGYLGKWGRGD
ncbi:hypothetical protein GUJ93_ZPchr0009g614 [Zizania palustris]|uniref:Uncharacterized protein n=1 Tax=Zizania palustris TaxID=103762 RepID=A0A8J5RGI0_ZIZPA|nr:hypothetical protein GUJ93_ZPchr0009g614 [Zizania palustris]